MTAAIGADDLDLFVSGHEALLRAISGIAPSSTRPHVLLKPHGVRSMQRLAAGDLGGRPLLALWPAELKEQAAYLYGGRLARPMIEAARAHGWSAKPSPHIAFRNAGPAVRLYMKVELDASDYAARWEEGDLDWVGAYSPREVRRVLWPWLRSRGYVTEQDGMILSEWISSYLGNRDGFMRAGLSLKRECGADPDPDALRSEVDAILAAAGEPALPARRSSYAF
jgi:hypothetical protein